DGVGQGDLQATQGDGGALVCRRQTAARAPLCALARADEGELAMPAGRGQSEHEEDRAGDDPETATGRGVRPHAPLLVFSSSSAHRDASTSRPAQTQNPPKNGGFVSSLSPLRRAFWCVDLDLSRAEQ